jgi:hypothetical protein
MLRGRGLHVVVVHKDARSCISPARPSPLAYLPQRSPKVVDVVADLLHFGPQLRLQALALLTAEPSGAAPLFLQPEALVLQLRYLLADLSSPAHVLSLR